MIVVYKRGSRGAMVRQIQKALHLLEDGIYGPLTEESVKAFQREHLLKADGVAGPATLAKMFPAMTGLKKSTRSITEIIVHCTATAEGKDYTVDDIRRWHQARGFTDVGYHYVIYRNGHIENGRDVNISGAHCTGHNAHSIGVCYVGGVSSDGKTPKDTRTLRQKAMLLSLLTDLKKMYPQARIYGHRDFANKACPSFDATKEYRNL